MDIFRNTHPGLYVPLSMHEKAQMRTLRTASNSLDSRLSRCGIRGAEIRTPDSTTTQAGIQGVTRRTECPHLRLFMH
jgi:hypothetical protein